MRADIYRADVQRAPLDHDGYCGFAIPIDWITQDDARVVVLEPECVIAGRHFSQSTVNGNAEAGDFVFRLDAGRDRLSGWVSSSGDPHRRIRLHINSGACVLAEQTACLFRRDAPAGIDPFHGFSVLMPKEAGPIDIREASTNRLLHRLSR